MKDNKQRIAWGITGSGHYLKESIEIINKIDNVDLFLSKAGEDVLKWYDYSLDDFRAQGIKIFKDVTASSAPVSLLYEGVYKLIVVSPATSNTIAQMAYGLSDNLITNIYIFILYLWLNITIIKLELIKNSRKEKKMEKNSYK